MKYTALETWTDGYNMQVSPWFATVNECSEWLKSHSVRYNAIHQVRNWEEIQRYNATNNRKVWEVIS